MTCLIGFIRPHKSWQPQTFVRLTGDCPLIDPEVIDAVIDFYLAGDYDYAANAVQPTFPDGLDVEVFRFSVLEEAWKEATSALAARTCYPLHSSAAGPLPDRPLS